MMSNKRGYIRSSETRSQLDMGERSKPTVVGRLIDNNHLMGMTPELPPDKLASVRRHIGERMHDVEDGKILAAALGVRWRDVGDWPDDWPIDAEQ